MHIAPMQTRPPVLRAEGWLGGEPREFHQSHSMRRQMGNETTSCPISHAHLTAWASCCPGVLLGIKDVHFSYNMAPRQKLTASYCFQLKEQKLLPTLERRLAVWTDERWHSSGLSCGWFQGYERYRNSVQSSSLGWLENLNLQCASPLTKHPWTPWPMNFTCL